MFGDFMDRAVRRRADCLRLIAGLVFGAIFCAFGLAQANDLQARLFASEDGTTNVDLGLKMGKSSQADILNSPVIHSGKPITRGGAMSRSLLIPGWGESYLGYHGTARTFFWTDVALWATAIGLEVYSRWREDQFMSFAATHSGAQMEGKSDGFYAAISNYMSTEEYNEAKLRTRDFDALYTDPAYFWAWDSDQNRREYDHIRISSRSAHSKIFFLIGAAALNRLISVIDSGKKAGDMLGKKQAPQIGWRVEPRAGAGAAGVQLVASAAF